VNVEQVTILFLRGVLHRRQYHWHPILSQEIANFARGLGRVAAIVDWIQLSREFFQGQATRGQFSNPADDVSPSPSPR
jgi:hypothetical protein